MQFGVREHARGGLGFGGMFGLDMSVDIRWKESGYTWWNKILLGENIFTFFYL